MPDKASRLIVINDLTQHTVMREKIRMKKTLLATFVVFLSLTSAVRAEDVSSSVGIKECDDYLAKVTACVSKNVPEAQRATFNQSVDASKKSWQELAKNEATKASLTEACKQALTIAKETFKAYNCSFD